MTDTNERIARQLGWTSREFLVAGTVCTGWARPDGLGESVPDYEHSLDALLEPLGVLRERGWTATLYIGPTNVADLQHRDENDKRDRLISKIEATPSEALALAVAEALEASK